MGILWDDDAWDDYLYWQTQDKKTLKRINALVKDIERTPYEGIGKPEPLKGNLSGWWSRRIDGFPAHICVTILKIWQSCCSRSIQSEPQDI